MVSKETDVELVNDRAIRRTVVSEGLRRVSLALAEEERAQLIQKYQGARASHRELMMEMKSNPEFKIARSKADAIELTPQQIMKNVVHDIRDPQKTDRNLDDDAITRN